MYRPDTHQNVIADKMPTTVPTVTGRLNSSTVICVVVNAELRTAIAAGMFPNIAPQTSDKVFVSCPRRTTQISIG